jgi:hypothetical protein
MWGSLGDIKSELAPVCSNVHDDGRLQAPKQRLRGERCSHSPPERLAAYSGGQSRNSSAKPIDVLV